MSARGVTGGPGALMVVGATSGAGKSTIVTALCRAFARRGVGVAPFKAQNMSTHTIRTHDGGLIGIAQAMQARAAGVEPEARMGPVLLRPSGSRVSDVVVLGEELGASDALGYADRARRLRPLVLETLRDLRRAHEHGVVVLEGAGGAAEINLLDRDLVNLPLAAAAGVPAVLVVDIERGGAFASAYGTWALLPDHLRSCLRGFVINTFRGDPRLLDAGLADLHERTGVPVLGVLPHLGEHVMLGVEDSLDLEGMATAGSGEPGGRPVLVAVIRVPRLSDPSAIDPLRVEPSVRVRWAATADDLHEADLVVVPSSARPEQDAAWLEDRGLSRAIDSRAHVLRLGARGGGTVAGGGPSAADVDLTDDDARHALLTEVARSRGRDLPGRETAYGEVVEAHLDHLADWVEEHLDVPALLELARTAVPPGEEPGW